jgi:hypothetical protein
MVDTSILDWSADMILKKNLFTYHEAGMEYKR